MTKIGALEAGGTKMVLAVYDGDGQEHKKRIDSLCQVLGLSERRFRNHLGEEIMRSIDYNIVEARAFEFRRESLSYIHEVSDAIRMNDND